MILEPTFSPGFITITFELSLALQSSLDHTWYPPEVISSSFAFGPTSRLQAISPMFVIVRRSSGVSPTTYVDAFVNALTLIDSSWQSTGASPAIATALSEGDCDGSAVGSEEGSMGAASADWLESGAGLALSAEPCEVKSHQIPKIKVPTARSSVMRLIQ